MSKHYCETWFDHETHTSCLSCRLPVDGHGNTEQDFVNCAFPDCGCDGERLCMAGELTVRPSWRGGLL